MRTPLRGRGTRHDDVRETARRQAARRDGTRHAEPAHLSLRTEPRPLG